MGQDIVNLRLFSVQTSLNLVKTPFRQILFPQQDDSNFHDQPLDKLVSV